jgi:flagellar basal-body rod protein FlgC
MSIFEGSKVLAAGLTAQRQRFETIVTNLANAHTTRTPEGGPYRKRNVVLEAVNEPASFDNVFKQEMNKPLSTVRVSDIVIDNNPPLMRYDPSHPDAGPDGYVALPNVDPAAEMVDLMVTTRSFQAMVAAMSALRDIVARSLELGK